MKVTFDLSDADVKYFRSVMAEVRERHKDSTEERIVAAARKLLEEVKATDAADFITERIEKLRRLIEMLEDGEWALAGKDRQRVVDGIAYFADPEDIIPDRVPVLGFLDDAIMVELVVSELVHELEAYEDFCAFRRTREDRFGVEDNSTREEWLVARRTALHQRIRRRRERRRLKGGRVLGGRKPMSLF
jgi:uncharacterized membrane protein YkvA (DUF1232 family)